MKQKTQVDNWIDELRTQEVQQGMKKRTGTKKV